MDGLVPIEMNQVAMTQKDVDDEERRSRTGQFNRLDHAPPTRSEIQRELANASRCPRCGIPYGFAMGTGDCGCEIDPE